MGLKSRSAEPVGCLMSIRSVQDKSDSGVGGFVTESRQGVLDDEHLRLLSHGYVLSGAMTGLFSLPGQFYAGLGRA